MKLLFFSDIHGVPDTLEKFFEWIPVFEPDRLILLGDALYHGPRNGVPAGYDPKRTAGLLNSRKQEILAVRGNCDTEVDQMMLELPVLSDFSEVLTENKRFFLTHGHHWNAANLPPVPAGTVFAMGHTHIPEIRTVDGITIFNPGSISLPKNDMPQTFGFFDGCDLSIHTLSDGKLFL